MTSTLEHKTEETALFKRLQITNAKQYLIECILDNKDIIRAYQNYSRAIRLYQRED